MTLSAIKTIFFDWDYTLTYTKTPENTMGERLAAMFQFAGMPYSREEIESALARYQADIAQGKIKRIVNPQTRREIARMYTHLFNYLGQEDRSWEVYERLYSTYSQLPTFLFEDSRATLESLNEIGYILGIISNHSRTARQGMEALVGDLIPKSHMIISEEIGVHKPAKSIFLRAAARVHTAPENCLLVGDNLQVDAIGSVQRGGFGCGVWLDRREKLNGLILPPKVLHITSLYQLPALLAG